MNPGPSALKLRNSPALDSRTDHPSPPLNQDISIVPSLETNPPPEDSPPSSARTRIWTRFSSPFGRRVEKILNSAKRSLRNEASCSARGSNELGSFVKAEPILLSSESSAWYPGQSRSPIQRSLAASVLARTRSTGRFCRKSISSVNSEPWLHAYGAQANASNATKLNILRAFYLELHRPELISGKLGGTGATWGRCSARSSELRGFGVLIALP